MLILRLSLPWLRMRFASRWRMGFDLRSLARGRDSGWFMLLVPR